MVGQVIFLSLAQPQTAVRTLASLQHLSAYDAALASNVGCISEETPKHQQAGDDHGGVSDTPDIPAHPSQEELGCCFQFNGQVIEFTGH